MISDWTETRIMSGAVDVYLGLGSNQGNRRENIDSALSMLDSNEKIHVDKVSDIIETEPWGFAAEQNFLNCVARVQVEKTLTPEEMLDVCKGIERNLGREENIEFGPDGKRVYHSRPIDIDILLFGNERVHSGRLDIPHPLMGERDFVMIPLRQVETEELRVAFPELPL